MVFLVTIMVTGLFLWASVLIVLKYHGDTSGCASGKPFQTSSNESTVRSSVSHPSTQNETFDSLSLESRTQDMENAETAQSSTRESKGSSKDSMKAAKRRQLRTRIVFIVFGVMVLVCTALLLVFSFSSFRTTVDGSGETTVVSVWIRKERLACSLRVSHQYLNQHTGCARYCQSSTVNCENS